MTEKLYKCTLLSDVVLNSKLATEGNMGTLDFIPGSNFLGIVAENIYKNHADKAYDLLHSTNVQFGDAHISEDLEKTYAMPFSLFKDKMNKAGTWVQFALSQAKEQELRVSGIQLKQERKGFLSESGKKYANVVKDFSIKSAQNRETRSSLEGKMFGMSALRKGQSFTFSINYSNQKDIPIIEQYLIGEKFIGKSKTAQYGQVRIEAIKTAASTNFTSNNQYVIVYVESNLCFFNAFGHPSYQPSTEELGLSGGEIIWEKSQIRTHNYSSWNAIRDTPNAQRSCILKGSVFYVQGAITNSKNAVLGEYVNEGFGRVIYNPSFLKANKEAEWDFKIDINKSAALINKADSKLAQTSADLKSPLSRFLFNQKVDRENSIQIAEKIHEAVYQASNTNLKKISPSQWGEIRAKATSLLDIQELEHKLFGTEGFLLKGVSAEKYWDKHKNRENFKMIFNSLAAYGTVAIAKYAAEMAKEASKMKNS